MIVKLDGGLGTSMGLSGPKSLPLVLMNSAITRGTSLDELRRHDGLRVPGVPDFLQRREARDPPIVGIVRRTGACRTADNPSAWVLALVR